MTRTKNKYLRPNVKSVINQCLDLKPQASSANLWSFLEVGKINKLHLKELDSNLRVEVKKGEQRKLRRLMMKLKLQTIEKRCIRWTEKVTGQKIWKKEL